MKIDILTLFPDMFTGVFGSSILKESTRKRSGRAPCCQFPRLYNE